MDVSRLEEASCHEIFEFAPDDRTLLVLNKMDLVDAAALDGAHFFPDLPCVRISALYGTGIDGLREMIFSMLAGGRIDLDSRVVITNLRHGSDGDSHNCHLQKAKRLTENL